MNKLVSIVLPVYNGEKYLAQSIESVLNQSYKNIELIIVNDCSTDSSEDIILHYKSIDDRIVYVKNEVNSKLPQSLNNGFKVAKGEYYTWTSDDNMYKENAIETMVDYLEKHTDVALVSCDFDIINENGDFVCIKKSGDKKDLIYNNTIGACFLYRMCVAKEVGEYDPYLFLVEDYDYWLRISLEHKIDFLHESLYIYRLHGNSLTIKKSKQIEESLFNLRVKYLGLLKNKKVSNRELFDYFGFVLSFVEKRKQRIKMQLLFSFKNPKYIKHMVYSWTKPIKK